ncbi:response regulator transcription factor [Opitutus sp. ER46]|uniref:response regulator n=1 Tax=Opitutus sp. ER46 TaxID=2161864 RepID=UPI000D30BFB9|nr:response regulator transcription factor [Opitutus sp. ER46]PTX97792.1 DNA-binding response regulator [Opitutus sp. ER46]
MKKLRILLVDDQSLFREALRTLLCLQPDFEVVAEAENGERALALAQAHRPDVVLMDLRMPVLGGVEATRRLLATMPTARVVVLTTFEEDEEIFAAMRAGALGYLLKACSAERLCGAVRAAAQGTSVLEPSVAARLMAGLAPAAATRPAPAPVALPDPLSEREHDVLRLLAAGCSNKEIGARLNIAEGTVKNHMTNVLGKLGALDRTQAALKARELGLV